MLNKIWFYLILIGIGLAVLAWTEENNQMLIKFSEVHGPSWLDTIGLFIILLGYAPMVIKVIMQLNPIYGVIGKPKCLFLIWISIFFLALIGYALFISSEFLLWSGILGSTISQAILIYYAFTIKYKI